MKHVGMLVLAVAFCSALFLGGVARGAAKTENQRNVVLFVVDDQGLDAGCYGNLAVKTPNLDKLSAAGTRFNYAFCTTSSCSASRSVILTGLYNHYNGQYGHQHSFHHFASLDRIKSLPVLLGSAGYRTARIGKYHVAPESVYHFDSVLKGNQGGSRNPWTMAERCRHWLQQESAKPFFLYFCTSDPHRSGDIREDLPHAPNAFGNSQKYDGITEVVFDPADVIVPPFLPDNPVCRAELAQYYQSVARIDQGLGHLVDILKQTGHWDDTMMIYISDNGIPFPGAKTTLYEPGMRLPCIVRNPYQAKRGIATDAMITWADLTPTILDFCGAKPPDEHKFHGRSFLSVLEQENPDGWDEVYASHTFHEITMYYPMRVVRERQYKLIWNIAHGLPYPFSTDTYDAPTWQSIIRSGTSHYGRRSVQAYRYRPKFELYDLVADPHEVVNLADHPKNAEVLIRLKTKLKDFQEQTGDPWLMKWEYE